MAYTTVDNPELYFQTKLYTGSNSDLSVTFDGSENMQPDWVWLKSRGSGDHIAYDSVRGTNKRLQPNATDAEVDRSGNNDELKSFNTNGWTLGTFNSNITGAGNSCVSWNWKAGTSFTNDASSTGIGTIDSTGSVNQDAGFSICSFTGNGTSGASVKHGLSTKPAMMIIKNRDEADSWQVYHHKNTSAPATETLQLNETGATSDTSNRWNDTEPTTAILTLGDNTTVNKNTIKYIGYIFSEIKGYSKFGSYVGNGNVSGTYIHLGMKPAWLLIKETTQTRNWVLYDNKRVGYNPNQYEFLPDTSNAEDTSTTKVDLLSNGFKIRASHSTVNQSGETYIYMAFAESPFVTSGGVPTTGR
jgi:hypothetical protein